MSALRLGVLGFALRWAGGPPIVSTCAETSDLAMPGCKSDGQAMPFSVARALGGVPMRASARNSKCMDLVVILLEACHPIDAVGGGAHAHGVADGVRHIVRART